MSSAEVILLQKIIDHLVPSGIRIPLKVVAVNANPRTSDAITFRAEAQIGFRAPYVEEYSVTHVALCIYDKEGVLRQCFEMMGRALLNDACMDLVGMHFPDVLDRYHHELHERYQLAMASLPTEIRVPLNGDPANSGIKNVTICGIPIHESLPISVAIHNALEKRNPPTPPTFDQEYLGHPAPADQLREVIDLMNGGLITKEKALELVGSTVGSTMPEPALLPGAKFRMARSARLKVAFWRK